LYVDRDAPNTTDAAGFAGLPPYRRGATPTGHYDAAWDVRTLHDSADAAQVQADLATDLARGATSLWLRFDAATRGVPACSDKDGIPCGSTAQLDALLKSVDLSRTALMLDAGANALPLAQHLLDLAKKRGVAASALRGTLSCDPLAAQASDGALPYSLDDARKALVQLVRTLEGTGLGAVSVSTAPYHDAGASSAQELGIALATGVTYLRWLVDGGVSLEEAARRIGFVCSVGGDLFTEIAKLRALRQCWAKVVAASGGSAAAQRTTLHAITSRRTKSQRDPWVNMLRSTTEAFSAMVGGADSLTTRGFDEALGESDAFAQRIARNMQVVLNEEAHVTRVADPSGGSYYVESLTDSLAREGWKVFQSIEAEGGMAKALLAGSIAKQIAEVADKRTAAIRKRSAALTGVSEFANLGEEPVVRKARAAKAQRPGALPVRRQAEPFEQLRDRADAHAKKSGKRPSVFLANLGAIPQHKARSTFSTGFLNAGGVAALDNDGFATPEAVADAFAASGASFAILCGSDDQYVEWVPKVAPLLQAKGVKEILLAGRPGDHEAAFKAAGVSTFIFMGADVVATLSGLLDRMGVAS
ncbi:MAG TPA: methylmalonyl-CoA mutase family protein, partial [Polyangiales bacterium]|nr:methylmalonyl-CoA mutase family protein [Polyangiales bacterium]